MSNWHGNEHMVPPNPYDLERRIALLEQSQETIKVELAKINANISKLVWIVLTAVVLGTLNVLTGGFTL